MNADVVIIGAGPAGIFTALEMVKKGSKQKIIMVEKGQAVENRHCPKDKTKKWKILRAKRLKSCAQETAATRSSLGNEQLRMLRHRFEPLAD